MILVIGLAEHIKDERDVEIELAGVFGRELARLELDADVARCPHQRRRGTPLPHPQVLLTAKAMTDVA
ncbi:hypothetical protein [Arthrobacter sp. ok362]|uniref:hypothetical protein n=1 Tax=Arthrobacter sp. ok362 TaxID=1761745 RepID=UPI000B848318